MRLRAATVRWRPRWPTRARWIASSPRCWRSSPRSGPTVLVVEDVHWADDATLDVLGYAARRVETVGRGAGADDARRARSAPSAAPAARRAHGLPGAPHRALAAVARRGAGAGGRHAAATRPPCTRSRAATRSSSPRRSPRRATRCPASVKDAVLARLRGLDADCREALERLSVVPSHVSPELAALLLGEQHARPARRGAGGRDRRSPRRARVPPRAGAARDREQPPGDARAAAQPGRRRRAARCRSAPSARG